jgi:hypothetical protein
MDEVTMLWTEKYCPKYVNDIIGNQYQIKKITQWLNSFENNKNKVLSDKKEKEDKKSKKGKNKKLKTKLKKKTINDEMSENDTTTICVNTDTDIEVKQICSEYVNTNEEDEEEDDENNANNESLQKIVKTCTKENSSCLFVGGHHGVGKTCTVLNIVKELDYSYKIINLSKIGSNKTIEEYITKLTQGNDILDIVWERKNVKRLLIIDELESITSPVEKNFIISLLKLNESEWIFPIIFIANTKCNKKNICCYRIY